MWQTVKILFENVNFFRLNTIILYNIFNERFTFDNMSLSSFGQMMYSWNIYFTSPMEVLKQYIGGKESMANCFVSSISMVG